MWHKYRAKRTQYAGFSFASKLESAVYSMLKLRESAGEIKDIQVQSHCYLTDARIDFIVDFKAFDVNKNRPIWIEAKGVTTSVYNLKRKLWKFYGPGELEVWKGTYQRPFLFETIMPLSCLLGD